MTSPGTEMQSLLRAARGDAPSAAAKKQMYARVLAKSAAGASAAPLAAKLFGTLAGKLIILGVGAATVAGLVGLITPRVLAPTLAPDPVLTIDHSIATGHDDDAPLGLASPVILQTTAPAAPGAKVAATATDGDSVEREARWVAEARTALMLAATKARAARALPSKMFEPEELRILGRALRVVGDDRGADAAFAELVAKYPEEALRP
jgi:hypothetical protein